MGLCRCEFSTIRIIKPKFPSTVIIYLPRNKKNRGSWRSCQSVNPNRMNSVTNSHFQEPFFSKGICGHRRKGSIREQLSPCHSVSSTREGKHWECQRLILPGPTESVFTFIRIQSDGDLYKLNAAKETTKFRSKASAALCTHNCWKVKKDRSGQSDLMSLSIL